MLRQVAAGAAAALCRRAPAAAVGASRSATLNTQAAGTKLWGLAQAIAAAPTASAAPAPLFQAAGLRWLLRQPLGSSSTAGAVGLRQCRLNSSGAEGLGTRLKVATASPGQAVQAVRSAGEALSKAPGLVCRNLPQPARRLLDAAQQPGQVNRVLGLQLTAFWQAHGRKLIAVGAALLCYFIYRFMYRTSQLFVNMSEGLAASGFLAMAAAMVAFGYLWLRRKYTVDPSQVYRLAMFRLNTHPGLLEVMGPPLAGSDLQASVLTGGRLKFKGLRPRLQSRRVQMIFPLRGSERRGLVSLEAKKRHGAYRFKLLAVDVPAAVGGDQRIFLEGGPSLYERGGVLDVLREPFLRALSLEETFEAEDEADDLAEEREAEKQAQQAQRNMEQEAAALAAAAAASGPKSLDAGGGMYFYERAWFGARRLWDKLNFKEQRQPAREQLAESRAAPAAGAVPGSSGSSSVAGPAQPAATSQ